MSSRWLYQNISPSFTRKRTGRILCDYYLPLEKCLALHTNKFDSLYPPKNLRAYVSCYRSSGSSGKIFKSNTCIHVIVYFILLQLSPLRKKANPVVWPKLNPLYTRMFYARFAWNWPSGSGVEITKFYQCDHYLPLEKCSVHHLNIFEFPLPKNTLCQVKLKMVECFRSRRFSYFVNIFFSLCFYYIPLEFIWAKLNSIYSLLTLTDRQTIN